MERSAAGRAAYHCLVEGIEFYPLVLRVSESVHERTRVLFGCGDCVFTFVWSVCFVCGGMPFVCALWLLKPQLLRVNFDCYLCNDECE